MRPGTWRPALSNPATRIPTAALAEAPRARLCPGRLQGWLPLTDDMARWPTTARGGHVVRGCRWLSLPAFSLPLNSTWPDGQHHAAHRIGTLPHRPAAEAVASHWQRVTFEAEQRRPGRRHN